ncbi:MAG: LytTR family DNA-binding domain-containing protein [Microscillaceae bacterium]|jgi:DNA-binding LytR/AlgR family response regulator|nr:LytTR family DNA-binding domain-containing protein [Microscillaceae bacterium]
MIKCIIIDDEPLALDILEDYIQKIPYLKLVKKCGSALEALECLKRESVQLIFLDIQMPDLTGIQFMKALPKMPDVIFTTAYSDYAIEGFNLNAVDYLLKPISFDRFLQAVNKYYDRIYNQQNNTSTEEATEEDGDKFIFVKTEYKIVKVNLKDVLYIEGLKDYIRIVLPQSQLLTLQSMKYMESTLPNKMFVRVHKSYIVSIRHLETIERNKIKVRDKWIPIGNTYRDGFYRLVQNNG